MAETKRYYDIICEEHPAMSANFAHTLEDMAEKYLKIQFIDITELTGIIPSEDLALLKASRANVIVYNNVTYEYAKVEDNLYYYISTTSEDGKIAVDQIVVNGDTGEYKHMKLANAIEEAPVDGNTYARQNKAWVKISNEALAYTFMSGPLNKEEIELSDLDGLNKSSNPDTSKIDVKYVLDEDSYIWFVSLKTIDYIAHAGGLEIDYEDKGTIVATYDGKKETWYCYRTTYQLLSGTWNLIVKFTEEIN